MNISPLEPCPERGTMSGKREPGKLEVRGSSRAQKKRQNNKQPKHDELHDHHHRHQHQQGTWKTIPDTNQYVTATRIHNALRTTYQSIPSYVSSSAVSQSWKRQKVKMLWTCLISICRSLARSLLIPGETARSLPLSLPCSIQSGLDPSAFHNRHSAHHRTAIQDNTHTYTLQDRYSKASCIYFSTSQGEGTKTKTVPALPILAYTHLYICCGKSPFHQISSIHLGTRSDQHSLVSCSREVDPKGAVIACHFSREKQGHRNVSRACSCRTVDDWSA